MATMNNESSPLTGIFPEDKVIIDFGEYAGKSVLEVADTLPDFYEYLLQQKDVGNFLIKRAKDKTFVLHVQKNLPVRVRH